MRPLGAALAVMALTVSAGAGLPGLSAIEGSRSQAAQQPQPPTFRTGTELVRVDVTVLDRLAKPVTTLTVNDFSLEEDGVPQKIQTFQRVHFGGPAAPEDDLELTIGPRDRTNPELFRDDVRLFLIFWDEYHIHPDVRGRMLRDDLVTFIRKMLAPTDLVAIMDVWTPMSDLWFSRDRYKLATQASELKGRLGVMTPRNGAEENQLSGRHGVDFVRERVALSALKSAIAHLGALRESRKTVLYFGLEFGVGRDTTVAAMDIIQAANAANVAVYSINPVGLRVKGSNFRSGLLASIAHGTGGESFVSNSPAMSMARAVVQASGSYLLGYAPSPLRHDGKFHKIEVKVRGSGMQVRARSGYVAPDVAQKQAARIAALEAVLPAPIESALAELAMMGRSEPGEAAREARTIMVPASPSPALSLQRPVLWLVQRPAEMAAARAGTAPPHAGREFVRTDRVLMAIAAEGELASQAEVSIRLLSVRGKPLTDLPFSRTGNGSWLVDLPLQSIARGDYVIEIAAVRGDQRAAAYVPVRVK